MKKLAVLSVCFGCFFAAVTCHAIDLKQSKVTQVVNDVQIISAADQQQKAATVNDIFAMPDILRTGAASRAELVAPDETVTRVGANTIFSFDPENRSIDLKQGSLLFHSPHGKGGGTIHTGSATASVLGTTLIVVKTPNGGLKVIALEGEVEVKFLNGLKQKLDPGMMTFVLPGANQLAPVIIFRLDELTRNSLLIKGFANPLASLSLIQNQIDKQLKLISLGKFTDTGLDVGDNANGNQVQVLDANTITGGQNKQPPPPPPPPAPVPIISFIPPPTPPSLTAAEALDATINQPSLTDSSIPTPPVRIFLGNPFALTGNIYFGGQTFSGFVAKDIFVNTPAAGLDPLVVNMSPWATLSAFDIVAVGNFSIEGPVTFSGLGPTENFSLIAGGQFSFTPGITVRADANDFTLSSPNAMTFDNVSLVNEDLDINLNSGDSISFLDGAQVNAGRRFIASAANNISVTDSQLTGGSETFSSLSGSISLEGATLNAGDHANFIAPTSISLDNSTINANSVSLIGSASTTITINNTAVNAQSAITAVSDEDLNVTGTPVPDVASAHDVAVSSGSSLVTDPSSGTVSLTAAFGSVNVSGTSITAQYLTLNSGDGILLDGSGQTFTASGASSTASFTAPNTITVNNADFSSFAVINMAANTIVLANDILAAVGNFGCLSGQANFAGAVVPGDVNFFNDKTSTGVPVTPSNVNLTSGPGISGLNVYANK